MSKGFTLKKIKGYFYARKYKNELYIFLLKMKFGLKKAIKPSVLAIIFSNSFTYNQAEQIKKRSNLCPHLVRNTPYSTFKVGQLFTYLSWSHPAGTYPQNDGRTDVDAT